MSTMYRVKNGETETCGNCETTYTGGDQMIRLTSLYGQRLGNCCLDCYISDKEEMDERWMQ